MGAPYSSVTVSGYNANPPADDGSQVAANEVDWSTIKEKLPDPLKTAIESMNTALLAGFAKVLGGAGVTSTATDYSIDGSSDQGKLIRATASGITITTPDATAVLSPWVCAVLNNSSGTITVDGSGTQTIDGNANITLPAGGGTVLFTDGTNWFTTGTQGTLVGKQLMVGDIINGTIQESNGSNAVTFSLKTLAGSDPSVGDPVLLCFRNTTAGTGNYVYRAVTAALNLTVSSGSTLGAVSSTPFDVCGVLFDDAGTVRMGVMNPLSSTDNSLYQLAQVPMTASSTAEGGAGAADSSKTFYTGTAVTSKAYIPLFVAKYSSGLATAGSWNVSPTTFELYRSSVRLPNTAVLPMLHVQDQKTAGTAGGTFTSGAWRTRTLNTSLTNEISGASLGSSQITLPAGTYDIDAFAVAGAIDTHQVKIRNTTDSTDILIGRSAKSYSSGVASNSESAVRGRFTLAAQKVLELQHQCQTTGATTGFGYAANLGVTEVYSDVRIWRVA